MTHAVDLEEVQLAARGDADAFASLYERDVRCVWAFVTRRAASREAAEELAEARVCGARLLQRRGLVGGVARSDREGGPRGGG